MRRGVESARMRTKWARLSSGSLPGFVRVDPSVNVLIPVNARLYAPGQSVRVVFDQPIVKLSKAHAEVPLIVPWPRIP